MQTIRRERVHPDEADNDDDCTGDDDDCTDDDDSIDDADDCELRGLNLFQNWASLKRRETLRLIR